MPSEGVTQTFHRSSIATGCVHAGGLASPGPLDVGTKASKYGE
jgi:hypothetical protein